MYYYHVFIVESDDDDDNDDDRVVTRSKSRAHVCSSRSRARGPEIRGGNRKPGEVGGADLLFQEKRRAPPEDIRRRNRNKTKTNKRDRADNVVLDKNRSWFFFPLRIVV